MLLQFILLSVCGLLYVVSKEGIFSPVRMFLFGWLIVLGTSASGMVRYDASFAVSTFTLVFATLCAFVGGAHLATRRRPVAAAITEERRAKYDRITLTFLYAFSLLGAGFVTRDLVGGGFAVLTDFSSESSRVRNELWTAYASGNIEVSPVRSLGIVSCLALATLLPYATKHRRRFMQLAAGGAATVLVVDSFLMAGRFTLGVLAICLLVSASIVYGDQSLRRIFTPRRLLIGASIGFYFLVVFPTQRNPNLAKYVDRSLWYSGDAHLAGWTTNISELPGMKWFDVFAYSTSYFSGALDKLNYFVTETEAFSWYQLGLYNIPQISQISAVISNGVTPWHETRLGIAALMRSEGWSINPWSTGLRDFGIDFGILAIPVIAILGFAAQAVYDKCTASGTNIGLIGATYISIACLIFAFISPFQIRVLSNGFWLLGVLAVASYLLTHAASRHPVRRRPMAPHR